MNESKNPQSEPTPELLEVITPGEAAVLFRVSTGTIKKWYDLDQLDGYRLPATTGTGFGPRRIFVSSAIEFAKTNNIPIDVRKLMKR